MATHSQKHPVGTQYMTRGKSPKKCTVIDFHTTRNLKGEIVKTCYVSTHEFMGQTITDYEVPHSTVDLGLIK